MNAQRAAFRSTGTTLLGPNLPHTYRSGPVEGWHRALVLQFRPDLLGDRFLAMPEMQPLKQFLDRAACGLAFTLADDAAKAALLARLQQLPTRPASTQVLELLEVLDLLAREASIRSLSQRSIPALIKVEDQQRINAICKFLCEHYAEEIDYQRLTRKLRLSQASLCRLFRRLTGRT
jgi:hypothetical protein